jgi:hypothetical protein
MTHRQRVLTALQHQEPDQVPLDLWGSDTAWLQHVTGVAPAEIGIVEAQPRVEKGRSHEKTAQIGHFPAKKADFPKKIPVAKLRSDVQKPQMHVQKPWMDVEKPWSDAQKLWMGVRISSQACHTGVG